MPSEVFEKEEDSNELTDKGWCIRVKGGLRMEARPSFVHSLTLKQLERPAVNVS